MGRNNDPFFDLFLGRYLHINIFGIMALEYLEKRSTGKGHFRIEEINKKDLYEDKEELKINMEMKKEKTDQKSC